MGRGDPLDDPELEAIERCLDDLDLKGAQARLATVGQQPEYAEVAQYFVARLLFLKGHIGVEQVAERMREVLNTVGYFPSAAVMLHQAETGHLARPTGLPPPSMPPSRGPDPANVPHGAPSPGPFSEIPRDPAVAASPSSTASQPDPATRLGRSTSPRAGAATSPRRLDAATAMAAENPLRSDPPGAYDVTREQDISLSIEERRMAPTEPRGPLRPLPDAQRGHAPLQRSRRSYTPVGGMPAVQIDEPRVSSPGPARYPDIPRGPRVPEFESNRAPPSYVPEERISDFGPISHKGALPRGAGRYSQRPDTIENLGGRRRRTGGPVSSSKPSTREQSPSPARDGAPHTAGRPTRRDPRREPSEPPARPGSDPPSPRPGSEPRSAGPGRTPIPWSDHPPSSPGGGASVLPPLSDVTRMVEAGQFVRAIATVNRGGARIPADYALLRARALAGAGYADQAFEALAHLTSAPLIAPEVRAGSARLFVELGEPAKGLDQAIEALREDPDTPMMRLTYALCAVRCARRQPDESLLVKAERALESFAGRAGPHGLLARGLEASIHAGLGEADRAITLAEQTLAADPASVDALAALVESYARITRDDDARRQLKRLTDLAPDEAEALLVRLPQLRDRGSGSERPPRVEAVWEPSEVALLDGKRAAAIETVEKLCEDYVGRMSKSASQSGLTAMATVASTCLTRAPVLSSFAPYDLSLYSVERLEAALGILYGKEPRPRLRTDESGLRLLVGSYIGEAIRLARSGRWEGRVSELQRARVVVGDEHWYPFQAVSARLHSGGRSRLADGLRGALALRGSPPWNSNIPNPVIPPVPWGRDAWPRPSDMSRLGRAVMRSPISEYCKQEGHGFLDLSLSSMGGMDAYLQLLSPVTAPRHEDAAWARRVAVFVGGYLGEVLLDLLGGRWAALAAASSPADFVVVLPDAFQARPVEWAYLRLTGEHGDSATDYVRTTARRATGGSA